MSGPDTCGELPEPSYADGMRAGIAEERRRWIELLTHGCGDNSCMVHKPRGMATNGGCQCCKVLTTAQRRAFLAALETLRAKPAEVWRCDECGRTTVKSDLRPVPANTAALSNNLCSDCRARYGWTDEKLDARWKEIRALLAGERKEG